jgi:hypothetical protein
MKSAVDADATKKVVVSNYNGGMSFSIAECFRTALKDGKVAEANKHLVSLVNSLAIFGTSDTRIDVSSQKMTDEARVLFYEMAKFNLGMVCQTIREVYVQNRAPKVSHVVYLTALLTSATPEVAGSQAQMVSFRSSGYSLVPMFRMTTHLFDWINVHLSLCAINAATTAATAAAAAKAPGLSFAPAPKTTSKSKGSKLSRAGGTGQGFRTAVTLWYTNRCQKISDAMGLAYQVAKYGNREGFTHKDVLSLIHIEMTDRKKCKCKSKSVCKCPVPEPHELKNLIPVAGQIVLAYAVSGLDHAGIVLCDGIARSEHFSEPAVSSPDIQEALRVFAFFCAVEKSKADHTPASDVATFVRLFRLTREMVSTSKLSDLDVAWNLLVKNSVSTTELVTAQRLLLLEKLPLHTLINQLFDSKPDAVLTTAPVPSELQIGQPATALVRNLNKLENLLAPSTNPRASELMSSLTKHLTNPVVLEKGLLHPINLFNAWSVYSRGRGDKSSATWTPFPAVSDALYKATELSFKGLKGYDFPIAFLVDASGSMSWPSSCPGMPAITALDVSLLLTLCMYRASALSAEKTKGAVPNHLIGYFGGGHHTRDQRVSQTLTLDQMARMATERSSRFTEVSSRFNSQTTLEQAKAAVSGGGVTDVGSGLWYLIKKLSESVAKIKAGHSLYKGLPLHRLSGFYELLVFVTDNDVNSGDQVMDVMNIYWGLVRETFKLVPLEKDGTPADPEVLFNKYMPRMVVITTSPGSLTVGDPRDNRILNICGFDSSVPALIDTFVKKGQVDPFDSDDTE